MNLNFKLGSFELSVGKSVVSPDVQAFLTGTDVDADQQGAKLVNPYAQSAWIYVAVSILAQNLAMVPFRISRVKGGNAKRVRSLLASAAPQHRRLVRRALGEDLVTDAEVTDLFRQPHPSMDGNLFMEMLVTWLSLRGEFFVAPLDREDQPVDLKDRRPRVERLLALDPGLFWHLVQGYSLELWRYTGSPLLTPLPSEMLQPSEVIHSRTPNPYLYWRGLSPIFVAGVPAQTDFAGEQFQKGLWTNNADTGVIVTTDQQVQPDQRAAILSALRERKRKAGTADRPLFLWGGAKIEKPTLSMMDMQFLDTRKFLRQEIFSIFKVPESMAGFTSDLNDGGAGGSLDATKVSFMESTVGALATRIEAALNPVVQTFGDDLVGWFDIDSLPIMQAARRARWDTATKMFAMGVPMDDINTNLDLGLESKPWFKNGYLPFNLQIAGEPAELPGEDETEPNPDDEAKNIFARAKNLLQGFLPAPAVRSPKLDVVELWKKHIAARRASVNLVKGKVGKVLNVYRGKVLAKLAEVHLEKSANRLGELKSIVDLVFNHHDFGQALNQELHSPLQMILQSAGEELLAEIGHDDPWHYPPSGVKEFLAKRTQKIMGVGGTVRDQLNTSLAAGIEAGETHDQLAARVKEVFNKLADGEARRVAQTEVNLAYNDARHQAMSDAGIEYKAWLSSHGPNVRPAHAMAEMDYVDDPIPLDEPFNVGGEKLMFPGDDSLGASPGNIINCQCIQLAAQKKDEDEKSATFKIFGFGEMKFIKK